MGIRTNQSLYLGTHVSVPPGYYNALNYGVVTDQPTLNQQAVIETFRATCLAANKRAYFPAGTYHYHAKAGQSYGQPVNSSEYIFGDGATTIFDTPAAYGMQLAAGAGSVTLRDFALQGDYANSLSGIVLLSSGAYSSLTLTNLAIKDMYTSGIYCASGTQPSNVTISGCTIHHCGDTCIVHGTGACSAWLIENTVCYDANSVSMPGHGIYLHDIANVTVRGCTCYTIAKRQYGYSGFEFDDCTSLVVDTCTAHDCKDATDSGGWGGYGFIVGGSTTATYTDCTASTGNYRGFYQLSLTGSASYTRCVGHDGTLPTATEPVIYP